MSGTELCSPASRAERGKANLRNRWRGLVFAAGVALGQIGPGSERPERSSPPYMLLLTDSEKDLWLRETVGATVLTESLDLADPQRPRLICNQN